MVHRAPTGTLPTPTPRPQGIERPEQPHTRVRGGAGDFANLECPVWLDRDEIGERPADVHADARHGATRCFTSSAIPASVRITTTVPTQSPSRT